VSYSTDFQTFLNVGGGKIAYRLSIEGIQYEAVTHVAMQKTTSDGRIRSVGLKTEGVKLSQKSDPITARVEANGATFAIVDQNHFWTDKFNHVPEYSTFMRNVEDDGVTPYILPISGAATIETTDSDEITAWDWPETGYLYIDQETIKYDNSAAPTNTFVIVERGVWDSVPRSHYGTTPGADLQFIEITNRPVTYDGRRVVLYAYTHGMDPGGDGEEIWRGVVSIEPRWNGIEWEVTCDPLTTILDFELGGDTLNETTFRGIYYPSRTPPLALPGRPFGKLRWYFFENSTSTIPSTSAGGTTNTYVDMNGFWENINDFVFDLNHSASQAMATGSFENVVTAIVDGDSYYFQYTTDGTPRGLSIWSDHAEAEASVEPGFTDFQVWNDAGISVTTIGTIADTTYTIFPNLNSESILPRGIFNSSRCRDIPVNVLYIATSQPLPSDLSHVTVEIGDDTYNGTISAIDSTNRTVTMRSTSDDVGTWVGAGYSGNEPPVVKLTYGVTPDTALGTYGLISDLIADDGTQTNLGAQPGITSSDIVSWSTLYDDVIPAISNRRYIVNEATPIADLICPDLLLLGAMLSLDEKGKLTAVKFRLPSLTETGLYELTKDNIIGWPAYEMYGLGQYSGMKIRDGWDPIEEIYTLPEIQTRDIRSYSRRSRTQSISVELVSTAVNPADVIDPISAVSISNNLIGILGNPYSIISVVTNITALGQAVGTGVTIDSELLPNQFGGMGGTITGIILGREVDLTEGQITLTILAAISPVYGYAAGAVLSSISAGPTNTPVAVCFNRYFNLTIPAETAAFHFEAGDRIKLITWDSYDYIEYLGYVTSASGFTINITTDDVFQEGSNTWYLTFADAGEGDQSENQRLYCYIAEGSTIHFDPPPSEPARRFSSV
jgi:hypothetical protein